MKILGVFAIYAASLILLYLSSTALSKEHKNTADCLKPCKSVKECNCFPFSETSTNKPFRFCEPLIEGSDEKVCKYFVRFGQPCSYGTKSNKTAYGYLPCADEDPRPFKNPTGSMYKKTEGVQCRKVHSGIYRCGTKCRASNGLTVIENDPYKFKNCVDKDGYSGLSPGRTQYSCNGPEPNTWLYCSLEDPKTGHESLEPLACGATGASCSKYPCCPRFRCNTKTNLCERDCISTGQKCKGYDCCKERMGKKIECSVTETGTCGGKAWLNS